MPNDKINLLLSKLETLFQRQNDFLKEIQQLQSEINELKSIELRQQEPKTVTPVMDVETAFQLKKEEISIPTIPQPTVNRPQPQVIPATKPPKTKSEIEKFIGENLINKIGIAITIIGVGIGAKYSIEHNLISPLTRIMLGYLMGIGLLAIGMKLKKNYEDFSAVLVSGSMAILYFITYSAYAIYDIIPQLLAFGLMVLFTVFTVVAALTYNKQIIAHIGLVGAYAVPFLLSEGSGKVAILFSYMAILNVGILILSFKKYWKLLYYSSFSLTWIIFFSWYLTSYFHDSNFTVAFTFLCLFFVIFYLTFLAYKLLRKEQFEKEDAFLLLANSFIFYGIGYLLLDDHSIGRQLLGLYTLCNAVVHFIVSVFIYKRIQDERKLFYLVSGLVLVFITITIPVQLDGHWVTLLWAGEAALLFWIGRTKNALIYEKLSYYLMFLAVFSIMHDWSEFYSYYYPGRNNFRIIPLININFLSSFLFIAAFGFITYIQQNKKYSSEVIPKKWFAKMMVYVIPTILISVTYFAFRMEIENYWNQLFHDSASKITEEGQTRDFWNYDFRRFKFIWIVNYSLFFFSILSFISIKKIKNYQLGIINLGLNIFVLLIFLTQGLYTLNELRETYLNQTLAEYYQRSSYNVGVRYISFAFVALILFACYYYVRHFFARKDFRRTFDLLLHVTILWIVSNELINWMELVKSTQSDKLGISILWGVYSMLIITLGIWKKKSHLRIGAMVLFGITLLKLFFYDIAELNTIAKTIVFVSLGLLLLIISFLYNKYKHLISDETND